MPIETYKDPQTGEERRRWVAPQATAPKPQAPKPAAPKAQAPKPKDDGFDLGDAARSLIQNTAQVLTNPAAAVLPVAGLVQQASQSPATRGALESVGRTVTSGARQLVQEGYDYINDELSKVGLTTATTAEQPDAPLPILGRPLPKVEGLSKGEEIVGNVLGLGAAFLATRGAIGRAGGAVAQTRIGAPIAQQGARLTSGVRALRNTPIPAAGQPGRAAAIGKKAAGLVIEEGAQGAVAGAVTSYVFQDPWSGNLSNALKGTPLESPFTRWSQVGPGDSSQEARFKNAVTDFVYGIPFGIGLGAAGDAIKAATAKAITKTVKVAVAEEAATKAAAEAAPAPAPTATPAANAGRTVFQRTGDPDLAVRLETASVEQARIRQQIETLGPEPEKPLKGEVKTARSRAHLKWQRKYNALNKELTGANEVAREFELERDIEQLRDRVGAPAAPDSTPQRAQQVEPQGTVDINQPIRDPEGRVEPTVDPVEKARVELQDAQRELQELAAREMEPPAPPAAAAAVVDAPTTVVDAPDFTARLDAAETKVTGLRQQLEQLGAEPPKPRSEKQRFGAKGKEGADPAAVARWEAENKAYNSWRRKYLKLKKEEVAASNEAFGLRQQADEAAAAAPAPQAIDTPTAAAADLPPQVFHGTSKANATAIREGGFKASGPRGDIGNALGDGVFFTSNPKYAADYGPEVLSGNPAAAGIRLKTISDAEYEQLITSKYGGFDQYDFPKDQQALIKEFGNDFDGVRVTEGFGGPGDNVGDEIVVFDPKKADALLKAPEPSVPSAGTPEPTGPLLRPGAELYHGTTEQGRKGIMADGFRVSEAEKAGTVLGEGVYFAGNEKYAAAYGGKSAWGQLPDGAKILDLQAQGKTVGELADEIGVTGPREVYGGDVRLSYEQQRQVKDWALANGYDGIRYRSFDTPDKPELETVIYNVDLANRIVGSKAAPAVVEAPAPAPVAPSYPPAEVQELDATLAKSMANLSPEQRVAVRDQMLAEKYGTGSPDEPVAMAGDGGMEPPAPPEVRPAVEPPDPEDFARRINENIDAIRSGDMDLQEAMSGNVRRYISRSGKTVYRPSAPEEMIATNKALSDMLTSRADATGIASYSVDDVYQEAARRLNRDGLNVELTIQRMEAARAGDPRSQEDLIAQAALILHRDDMAQQNGIAAIEFQNNVDEGVKADAMRRLWAGYEDQLKLDGALMAATRKDAQRMRLNQGPDRVRIADGATPAPDLPDQTVQQIADQEIANPANSLMDKLDPEIRADIENGVLGPDAEAMTDLLTRVVITSRDTKGLGPRFAAKMKEVPTGRLTQDFILQAYRSSLLGSIKTIMKMLLGSSYRVMTLGASQAFGALGDAALQGVRGNARGTANALRRAGLDMGIYLRMMSELPHALRLAGHSIKEGESFGNLGRNQMEMAQRGFTEADQAVLDAPEFAENVTRETTLNNPFFLDPENKNMTAQYMRKAWQVYSFSGRVAGSLDTFFSSLVGPSAEWARLMDLQLRQAEDLGMAPMKAWTWAADKTEELLDAQWAKVVTQGGSVIENGALTGKHAQVVMDWTNFTDPLDIKFQDRSYEYGIRAAKDEGLTDPAEIAARAQEWVNETPDAWKRAGMSVGNVVGLAPKLFQDAINHTPVVGTLQAFNRGPVNIVKAGMRATGFAAPLADTFWRDINSEDIFTRDRAIGEIATGWLTAVTAVTLATSGFVQLSGPGSLNPQVRQKMRNEGTRPFAIRFRNPLTNEWSGWWDLSPFDSAATILAGVATFMDTANNMPIENREAMANSLTLTIAETVRQVGVGQFTKGMYGGIMQIFDMFSDLETKSFIPVEGQIGAVEEFIQKKLTGFMPATFRNIRRGQDPYERVIPPGDWPYPFNNLQELGYRFMNEIPGLSENLPPRLHPITASPIVGEQVWGTNFIPPEQPWMRGLVQGFSPTAGTPFTMGSVDPVDNELKRLSGRGTAFIVWNANEFQIPNYRLDIYKLNRLAEITRDYVPPGRTTSLHGELTNLITSAEYQALPEATPSRATESARAIQINKVINYYKGFIKEEFRAQDPDVDARLARIEKQKLMNQNDAQMGIEAWTRRLTR